MKIQTSLIATTLLLCSITIVTESLPSLSEMKWHHDVDGGKENSYFGHIFFQEVHHSIPTHRDSDGNLYSLTTRGYGAFPGPTMVMEKCKTYTLYLHNEMSPIQSANGEGNEFFDINSPLHNQFRSPNHTNMHLHGLHISPLPGADYPFSYAMPGETMIYKYEIPCDHMGGTYWYHSHMHGATTLQVGGGALGMLVIRDGEEDGLPSAISEMEEKFLILHHLSKTEIEMAGTACEDQVFETNIPDNTLLVNGAVEPEITIAALQWHRLRTLYVSPRDNIILDFSQCADVCTIQLLAKDGVYLHQIPRDIPESRFFMTVSSRLDISILCKSSITCSVKAEFSPKHNGLDARSIATIRVPKSSSHGSILLPPPLPCTIPCRPPYLSDLRDSQVDNDFDVLMGMSSINGVSFGGMDDYAVEVRLGEVQEWYLLDTGQHPLHIHVHHMQVQQEFEDEPVPGWTQAGDWVDTVSTVAFAVVRFVPYDHVGPMLMHCHILAHADQGAMMVGEIVGNMTEVASSTRQRRRDFCGLCERSH